MRKLLLLGLALLPAQVEAHDRPVRMMLEVGLFAGSGDACHGTLRRIRWTELVLSPSWPRVARPRRERSGSVLLRPVGSNR